MDLDAFDGEWRIARTITDHLGGPPGRFDGAARFTPAPYGLHYRETGALTLGTSTFTATRDYLWSGTPDAIELRFPDGRFFHAIARRDPRPEATHSCGPDLYAVRYDFTRWPLWRAEWRVTGPRKDYAMVSDYAPIGRGGA